MSTMRKKGFKTLLGGRIGHSERGLKKWGGREREKGKGRGTMGSGLGKDGRKREKWSGFEKDGVGVKIGGRRRKENCEDCPFRYRIIEGMWDVRIFVELDVGVPLTLFSIGDVRFFSVLYRRRPIEKSLSNFHNENDRLQDGLAGLEIEKRD
jgi:hypothetical protein